MFVNRATLTVATGLLLAAPLTAADAPEQVLGGFGLHQEGDAWALPEQRRLGRLLDRFDAVLRRFHKSDQAWREQIERIDALERQLHSLETQYEESRRLLRQQSGSSVVQQQLQEQRGQLSQRLGELQLVLKRRQNEEDSELYQAARRHAAARAELLSATAAIEHTYRRLNQRHDELAASPTVRQVLGELRTATDVVHELAAPASHREAVAMAVKRARQVLQVEELPLLLSGGAVHVDLLAAGRAATFVVDEEHAQTLIPLSHAQRLGIPLHEQALWQAQNYGERKVRLCAAILSTLQLGSATLRDVEVYVTAAEDADLGLRLGTDVLDRIDLNVDSGRARIDLRPPTSRRDARP